MSVAESSGQLSLFTETYGDIVDRPTTETRNKPVYTRDSILNADSGPELDNLAETIVLGGKSLLKKPFSTEMKSAMELEKAAVSVAGSDYVYYLADVVGQINAERWDERDILRLIQADAEDRCKASILAVLMI